MRNPELWVRLQDIAFDDLDSAFPFTARLARDNGWSLGFARRAVEEYRRFVYLAMVGAREATPSDEVDQVWHLHLTYTRHYWGPFAAALGAPLHHGPTKGGAAEQARYSNAYAATLALYTEEFGAAPPADLWPAPEKRFSDASHMQRLNVKRHLVISKSRAAAGAAAGGAAALAAFAASAQEAAGREHSMTEYALIAGAILVATLLLSVISAAASGKKNSAKKGDGSGCSAGFMPLGCSGGKGGKGDPDGGGDSGCSGGGCGGGGD
jgi:hypothetical protein